MSGNINRNFLAVAKRLKDNEIETRRLATLETPPNNAERRNYIINGNFDISQRAAVGGGVAVSGQFMVDRWYHIRDGTAGSVSMGQVLLGSTFLGSQESTYVLRLNQTAVGTTQTYKAIAQRIEDVQMLAGQQVCVSFWARSALATTLSARIDQNFGTGGSAATFGATTFNFPLALGIWTLCQFTYLIPSTVGKTVGPPNTSYTTLLLFDISANGPAVNIFDFAQVSLQPGLLPSPFSYLKNSVQVELAACQRYYQKSFAQGTAPAQNAGISGAYVIPTVQAGAVNNLGAARPLPVVMRLSLVGLALNSGALTNVVNTYNPSAANTQARNDILPGDCTSTAPNALSSDNQISINATAPAGTTVGQRLLVHYTVDVEL